MPRGVYARSQSQPSTEFGRRLRRAREEAGFSLARVAGLIQEKLGNTERGRGNPSHEQIRQYEMGVVAEERADLVVVLALAELYGVPLRWLSPSLARQARVALDMLDREDLNDLLEECEEP